MELGFTSHTLGASILGAFKTVTSDEFAIVIVTSFSTNNNITPTTFMLQLVRRRKELCPETVLPISFNSP